MIDQFGIAVAAALSRHNEVTNMLISNDYDVIIYSNFHRCSHIDSFLICINACQKFLVFLLNKTAKLENGKSVRSSRHS